MPCHVPICRRRVGPSGWCMTHRNRLNARLPSVVHKAATLADLIAIADHPGWRRGYQLSFGGEPGAVVWYARGPGHRMRHATAADALADIDRISGRAPAAAYVARLEAEVSALKVAVAVARADREIARAYLEAVRAHRDALEERRRELAEDNDTLATEVHLLRFANGHMRATVETYRKRLEVYSAALDRQASDIARLTSELAERERDVTDLRAERDAYAAELETARRTALADADTIDNLRTGVRHLETALTLARRPWWRKVWAWVTGGAA